MSPTQRTLQWLRAHGVEAQVVEKIVPHSYIKIDLFGCIDIVALPDRILGIQTTTGDNHAHRATKARTNTRLGTWIQCGGGFEIWSWAKRGARGKRKLWTLRRSIGHLTLGTIEFTEEENND